MADDDFGVFLHAAIHPANHDVDEGDRVEAGDEVFVAFGHVLDVKGGGDLVHDVLEKGLRQVA